MCLNRAFNKFLILFFVVFVGSFSVCMHNMCTNGVRAFLYENRLYAQNNQLDIYTLTDLNNLAKSVNNGSFNYDVVNLKSDIYINTAESLESIAPNSHIVIGTMGSPFRKTFNGNGFTVYGMYNNNNYSEFFALFGYLDGAIINNVKIENCNIQNSSNAAGLCYSLNNSIVNGVKIQGNISSNIGNSAAINIANNSKIFNCEVNCTITSGGSYAAAIVNEAYNTQIINCLTTSQINANQNGGGICSYLNETSCIKNCVVNSINFSCIQPNCKLGVIAAQALGIIENCYYKNFEVNNSLIEACSYTTENTSILNCIGVNNFSDEISVTINLNTYTSIISALNWGASNYSSQNIVLNNWYNENSPSFSNQKQINEFVTSLVCENVVFGNSVNPFIEAKYGSVNYVYSTNIHGIFTSEKPINAGSYYCKAQVLETEYYTGLESEAVPFQILKAENSITLNNENISKIYDGLTIVNPTASSLSGDDIIFEYYNKADTNLENEILPPKNCGDYILKLKTPQSLNYEACVKVVEFSINKKELTDNTLNLTHTFNNTNVSLNINLNGFVLNDSLLLANIFYSLNGEDYFETFPEIKNAGEYTVYYKIEFENYITVQNSKIIVINKANYSNITHPKFEGYFLENLTLSSFVLNPNFYWVNQTQKVTCSTTHYNAIYNADPTNFNNYELQVEVRLNKQVLPILEFAEKYVYNGGPQTFSFKNLNEKLVNVNYFYKTDAGEYDILVTLKSSENYIFHNKENSYTLKFVILKANFENKTLAEKDFSFVYEPNKTLQNYIDMLHGQEKIPQHYYFYNKDMPITVGEHKILMFYNSDSKNYNNFDFYINLNITKASYNNLMLKFTSLTPFTINHNGEYVFVYSGESVSLFVTGMTAEMSAAIIGGNESSVGTYTVSSTIVCDPNYIAPCIAPLTYKIVKAVYNISEDDLNFTYSNNILKLNFKQGFTARIKINENFEFSDTVYIQPTNNLQVYYCISSENYEDILGSKIINLAQNNNNNNDEENDDIINNNPENDNNSDNNNSNNNPEDNNQNNNQENTEDSNENNNQENNSNNQSDELVNNKNGLNVKKIILISIMLACFVTVLVVVIIKIKRRQ